MHNQNIHGARQLDPAKIARLTTEELSRRVRMVETTFDAAVMRECLMDLALPGLTKVKTDKALKQLKQALAARLRNTVEEAPWTPFERADITLDQVSGPEAEARFERVAEAWNKSVDEVREMYLSLLDDEVYVNSRYQVNKRVHVIMGEEIAHLSIKRLDKAPIRDWRDMQRLKNELVGPECEGVELYPAESRVVDTANQYHLWVFVDPSQRFPFGWTEGIRLSPDDVDQSGAHQREFE